MDTQNNFEVLEKKELLALATQLTCTYIQTQQQEPTSVKDMSSIVGSFYQALVDLEKSSSTLRNRAPASPAVPIEESVHDNYIICLEDGKKLKMLKRHLGTMYKMSIEEYKERWGLSRDYPIVAPSYARRRSAIAKTTGLGRAGRKKMRVVEGKSGAAVVAR